MSKTTAENLSGVSETYLAPLYWRAMESQRPEALIKDEKAVALVTQMSLDFSRVRQIPMTELLKVMRIMFTREMDRYARDFLSHHPEAVVIHIGCGLDSRFERVDNGQVRIVNSTEEGCQLQPGEFLVAVTTNVGWTPIFPRAAAVVTDVGAPLSHAAIVARELGIPAVVGCGNATMRLKTGDCVRVDGGRGTVEILNG
jgi:phosphoenolpyruvate synthase/pyruvate phosphate dikinase